MFFRAPLKFVRLIKSTGLVFYFSTQERDSAIDMWQTSLKLITALETELKDYRDNSHLTSAVEKVNEVSKGTTREERASCRRPYVQELLKISSCISTYVARSEQNILEQ